MSDALSVLPPILRALAALDACLGYLAMECGGQAKGDLGDLIYDLRAGGRLAFPGARAEADLLEAALLQGGGNRGLAIELARASDRLWAQVFAVLEPKEK